MKKLVVFLLILSLAAKSSQFFISTEDLKKFFDIGTNHDYQEEASADVRNEAEEPEEETTESPSFEIIYKSKQTQRNELRDNVSSGSTKQKYPSNHANQESKRPLGCFEKSVNRKESGVSADDKFIVTKDNRSRKSSNGREKLKKDYIAGVLVALPNDKDLDDKNSREVKYYLKPIDD